MNEQQKQEIAEKAKTIAEKYFKTRDNNEFNQILEIAIMEGYIMKLDKDAKSSLWGR